MGVREELAKVLSGGAFSALGYDFVSNPQGFVLAVLWRELAAFFQGVANQSAATLAMLWGMLANAIIDPISFAVTAPGETFAAWIRGFVAWVEVAGVTFAANLGPFAFLGIPLAWLITTVVVIGGLFAIWNLYKWLRVVFL